MKRLWWMAVGASLCTLGAFAAQTSYPGQSATGKLVLTRTVNLTQQAQTLTAMGANRADGAASAKETANGVVGMGAPRVLRAMGANTPTNNPQPVMSSLPVGGTTSFGFNGLSHFDQRNANSGNQFSVEPPNASIATANGFILEGVNNAVQVFTTAGSPLLSTVLSSNQVFGVLPAINRTTGVNGVFPTDMRVFFDQSIARWFILQRAQDYDAAGNTLASSHLYVAVSQTADPTATYNIYVMDTTNNGHPGCPCYADFPQIGADQYGFYISTNEFNSNFNSFVDAQILAISKASLSAGTAAPTMFQFFIQDFTGFEFAIQPVTTPPDGSYFVASGGLEYFVSTNSSFSESSGVALWAMTNTASLSSSNPGPSLFMISLPCLNYSFPNTATQKPGPLPYGSTLFPPGLLATLDGGDNRMLSAVYAGGRIYATFATQVTDETGKSLVGGAYVILSPTLRNNVLNALLLRQGYLMVKGDHILRPAVAVNGSGNGAITFTISGADYYPSTAFVPISTFSTGTPIQVAAAGTGPEDGFTGYPDSGFTQQGTARWGDYSSATVSTDSSIWMVSEYIPNGPRTPLANWGTYITRFTH